MKIVMYKGYRKTTKKVSGNWVLLQQTYYFTFCSYQLFLLLLSFWSYLSFKSLFNHDYNKLHIYFKQNISVTLFCCFHHHITNVHYFTATYKFQMKSNNLMMFIR